VPVLAAAEGFTVAELAIHHRARQFGKSKFGARRFLKGFLDLLAVSFRTTFGYRPMHGFGHMAVLLVGLGFLLHLVAWFVPTFSFMPFLCYVFAGQAMFTGWLAELSLARSPTIEPYRIAETTPPRQTHGC
jgi:hypothetical protein